MNTYNIRNPLSASMKRIRGRERGREGERLPDLLREGVILLSETL